MKTMFKLWTRKKQIELLTQLEMYVGAGLPVLDSFKIIQTTETVRFQKSLGKIIDAYTSGQKLSLAFGNEIRPPPSIISLIYCGESTAGLSTTLVMARKLLESSEELKKNIVSAATYPLVIGAATTLLTLGLMKGVIPQIIPLLLSLHADLPMITRVVIAISGVISSFGIYIVLGLVAVSVISVYIYRRYIPVKMFLQSMFLKVPIVGNTVKVFSWAIMFQSLGTMIVAGIPYKLAIVESIENINLIPLKKITEPKVELIENGAGFKEIVTKDMPAFVSAFILAGESSGNLGESLLRIHGILDNDIKYRLKRISSLIEPVMMLVMGLIVGSIAASIMMPIYEISKTLQH